MKNNSYNNYSRLHFNFIYCSLVFYMSTFVIYVNALNYSDSHVYDIVKFYEYPV